MTFDHRRAQYSHDLKLALQEQAAHGDMIFVNMTEQFYLCAWKMILWYRYATVAFPSAKFVLHRPQPASSQSA